MFKVKGQNASADGRFHRKRRKRAKEQNKYCIANLNCTIRLIARARNDNSTKGNYNIQRSIHTPANVEVLI